MNSLKVTTPIINQLLLITVGFYNTLLWVLGQPLNKNRNGFAAYLSEGRIFCEVGLFFLFVIIIKPFYACTEV